MYQQIKKRDGRKVKFDVQKIRRAVERAGLATGEFAEAEAQKLANKAVKKAEKQLKHKVPTVE